MRIVRGRLGGRDLLSPGGRVRPTAEQVRDRWLTELESELRGARVLDLFAGTGALGLEALSRGAARVDFVEWSAAALHALKGNVTALGARKRSRIFTRDALVFMAALDEGAYDLALADPPYSSSLAGRVVELWQERPFARILSVEHPADATLPPGGRGWTVDGSGVTTYRARPTHETESP
ncbi:MAG: 16S rRNA (guanine(966)-N(2))-methyltransferase RsmD [Gemmatimonadales bacterium]|nr:MAG: 16S rRNA (guanine(966)-N(2))-methyltransferase RsmD [Gemmatimonadales bacterium]